MNESRVIEISAFLQKKAEDISQNAEELRVLADKLYNAGNADASKLVLDKANALRVQALDIKRKSRKMRDKGELIYSNNFNINNDGRQSHVLTS